MARPALSAARGIDILQLLAASPGRSLTLSEIARATGINVSSCHAVLTVLTERGYLVRDAQQKGFALGPALFAAGQAALRGQPLLGHAQAGARALFDALNVPVLMTMAVGDEIVGVASFSRPDGQPPLLHAGERRRFVPPIGAPFVAWASEAQITEWLSRAPEAVPGAQEELRAGVAAIRERGYEVLLRPTKGNGHLAAQLRALAAPEPGMVYLGPDMALPGTIEPDTLYNVTMIAAPVFDRAGTCAYNLCLGPFAGPLHGQQVLDHADRLLRACVQIMHADRAAG